MWQWKLPSHVCPLEEAGRWHLQWTKKVSILKYPDWFLCIFLKSVKDCVWEEIFAPQQNLIGAMASCFFFPLLHGNCVKFLKWLWALKPIWMWMPIIHKFFGFFGCLFIVVSSIIFIILKFFFLGFSLWCCKICCLCAFIHNISKDMLSKSALEISLRIFCPFAHVGLLAHLSKLSSVPGLSPGKIWDFFNDEEIEGYFTLKKELKSFLESSLVKGRMCYN
jgi:hypothetical protein